MVQEIRVRILVLAGHFFVHFSARCEFYYRIVIVSVTGPRNFVRGARVTGGFVTGHRVTGSTRAPVTQ